MSAHNPTVPPEDRDPIDRRPGTKLDPQHTTQIRGRGRRGSLVHGILDKRQRVYQSGGEERNFVLWSRKQITMDAGAWNEIDGMADKLEFVAHDTKKVYVIPALRASSFLQAYQAPGIGLRVGFPLAAFDVMDAEGNLIKRSVLRSSAEDGP